MITHLPARIFHILTNLRARILPMDVSRALRRLTRTTIVGRRWNIERRERGCVSWNAVIIVGAGIREIERLVVFKISVQILDPERVAEWNVVGLLMMNGR